VKRIALIAGAAVILGSLLFIDYKGYSSLKRLEDKIAVLSTKVDDASRLAQ